MRPLLSICVPTFSRAEIVYKTIQDHLSIYSDKIEVIVCDNHSPDRTFELLAGIDDRRFKLFANDKNMGFPYNLSRVLKEATGHFACMMSDEDTLIKEGLKQVLIWIEDFIENNVDVAVIIPNHVNLHTVTKEEELVNAVYGRVSYMSGLIINRDKLQDNDFNISNEYRYPHLKFILTAGVRGRIIYSDLGLFQQTHHDDRTVAEATEIQQDSEASYRDTYVEPKSRLEQFEIESNIVFDLDINKKLKWSLFSRQFSSKYLQGTVIYELITRNEELFKNVSSGYKVNTLEIEEEFKKAYIERVVKYLGEEYVEISIERMQMMSDYIHTVQQARNRFDALVNRKGYPGILLGSMQFIRQNVDNLLDYNFNISYVCTKDLAGEDFGSSFLTIEDLNKFETAVLIVDASDAEYINILNNLQIERLHLLNFSDLRIQL